MPRLVFLDNDVSTVMCSLPDVAIVGTPGKCALPLGERGKGRSYYVEFDNAELPDIIRALSVAYEYSRAPHVPNDPSIN